jgi:DNA-binding NarL/FixJ family response regulator
MVVIRVLLVDDQEIIRQGLTTILKYEEGIEVVGQAADGREAIALATRLCPDIVLMDLKMPELGGVPATRRILQDCPETHVIVLTTYDSDDLVFEALKAGARGYLLKDADHATLAAAIRGVARGEAILSPSVAHKVLGEFRRLAEHPMSRPRPGDPLPEPLTAREEQVLALLVEGLANREIAARLFLSEGTVRNHVSTIIAKLQANDRTHAVVTALRRGIVDL